MRALRFALVFALVFALGSTGACVHDWNAVTADGSAPDVEIDAFEVEVATDTVESGADNVDVPVDVPCSACGANCVVLASDPMNCGACGNGCTAPDNAVPTCARGTCGFDCAPGYDRCGDRCFFTDNNVSFCGRACMDCIALPHTDGDTVNCAHGACTLLNACAPAWADCDGVVSNGCETDITTQTNCGACHVACGGATPNCMPSDTGYVCVP